MANRQPGAQQRNNYQRDWGNYNTAVVLPNTAGFVAPANLLGPLEAGDTAYVTSTNQRYYCTFPGAAPGDGLAVWVPVAAAASASAVRYYDIVVGNAAFGDTLVNCDFLDVGNGMQWKAALAAAAAAAPLKKSVFTRRGTYDLGAAGSDGVPIVVPVDVLNVCDGIGQTAIFSSSNPAATGGIAALRVDGEIWDVAVVLKNPTSVNPSGTLGLITITAQGRARRVRVDHDVITVNARLGAISASVLYAPGAYSEDVRVENAPPTSPVGFYASHLLLPSGAASRVLTRLIRPASQGTTAGTQGGTIGIYSRISHVEIIEPRIFDTTLVGILAQAEENTLIDVQITDPYIVWDYADTVLGLGRSAITIQANQILTALGSLDSVRVTRGFFDNFSINGTGSRAIQFLAIGAGFISTVKNCQVIGATCRAFDEGVRVQGTGISTVNANGVSDSDVGQCTVGINNVNDVNFRNLGNW